MIETAIPLVENILGGYRNELGRDYSGYRNHVYRMLNFCFAQSDLGTQEREKLIIAGSFHDLGIWTADTFDYLPPSIDLATECLDRNGLGDWASEIRKIIDLHHRVRKHTVPLVDIFRKGDLVDFSLGIVKCGVPAAFVQTVKEQFPNEGFHKQLVRRRALGLPTSAQSGAGSQVVIAKRIGFLNSPFRRPSIYR